MICCSKLSRKSRNNKMLHLFKRVYLSIDETLDTARSRLVLSQDYGHPLGVDYINLGQLLVHATSVDDVIGSNKKFTSYLDFFKFLDTQHDKLNDIIVIYADRDSFVKIGTNYFKALLPLALSQDIYKMLSFYTTRQSLLCTNPDFLGTVQNYEKLKSKCNITEAEVSAEFFANKVNSIDFYNFFADKKSDLSLELLAATYSYNGSCKNEISNLLRAFIIRHAYEYAIEVRQEIVDTCLTPHTQSVLNIANVPINQMADVLRRADSTALFFDDRIFPRDPSMVNLDANWKKVNTADLVKVSKTILKVLRDISMWREDPSVGMGGATGFLECLQQINNPVAWNQRIEDLLDNLPALAINCGSYIVNTMLIHYIIGARKNSKELLRPFVINGCQ